MSGSVHNVEVYRCTACGDDVALSPVGFSITEEELQQKIQEHGTECRGKETGTDAQG